MTCVICENPGARMVSVGVWQEFHCPDCGSGRVSGELLNLMMLLNLKLDVEPSRRWVLERKLCDPLPMMRVADILLCRDAGPMGGAEG
jgi:tRNA(Ile2) C34 agmatinyltransferase TiaS